MARTLQCWRTARVPHKCTFCGRVIQPGQRYVASSLPPYTDIGNETWWHCASHGETGDACEAYWDVEPYWVQDPFESRDWRENQEFSNA